MTTVRTGMGVQAEVMVTRAEDTKSQEQQETSQDSDGSTE